MYSNDPGMQEWGGGGGEYSESEDVANQTPCDKMGNAVGILCLGMCVFPLALLVLAWNENSYVCNDRKILHAQGSAQEVGCDASLVMNKFAFFSCPLLESSLERYEPCTFNGGKMACDNSLSFRSASGSQKVEMYQCKEDCKTETRKNGMGQNEQTRKCTYQMTWATSHINSNEFHSAPWQIAQACPGFDLGHGNPIFPDNLEPGETNDYAQTVLTASPNGGTSGSFTLNHELVETLSPNIRVNLAPFARNFTGPTVYAAGTGPWTRPMMVGPSALKVVDNMLTTCSPPYRIGCVRISYWMSSAVRPSVITQVTQAGATQPAPVPKSWGCSASTWQAILPDKMAKEEMITSLRTSNYESTWLIRILGAVLASVAVCCCLQPLAAVADTIGDAVNWCPCGGFVEDFLEGIVDWLVCVVGCNVGFGASLLVISTVWIMMRPTWGIAMLIGGLALCGCSICFRQAFGRSKE